MVYLSYMIAYVFMSLILIRSDEIVDVNDQIVQQYFKYLSSMPYRYLFLHVYNLEHFIEI